jgi:hypothetical protein
MGAIRNVNPVKLFVGVLVSDAKLILQVENCLTGLYGPVDYRSQTIPFNFTNYYRAQMGAVIDRIFLAFERLIEADQLPEIKRQTNRIEEEMAPLLTTVNRPVNLDPGYLEQAKVILASTKNFYHRIHLAKGIFGEVTMHYRDNAYEFFPWTYPDFKSADYQKFFLKVRQIYRSQLRTRCITEE